MVGRINVKIYGGSGLLVYNIIWFKRFFFYVIQYYSRMSNDIVYNVPNIIIFFTLGLAMTFPWSVTNANAIITSIQTS